MPTSCKCGTNSESISTLPPSCKRLKRQTAHVWDMWSWNTLWIIWQKKKNPQTRRQEVCRAAGLQDLHLSGALRRFLLPYPSLPPPLPPPAGCQEPRKTKLKEALSCLCGEKTSREQEVFEKLHVWWNFSAVSAAAVHRDSVWSEEEAEKREMKRWENLPRRPSHSRRALK